MSPADADTLPAHACSPSSLQEREPLRIPGYRTAALAATATQAAKKIILLKDPPSYEVTDSSRAYGNTAYAERLQNIYAFILSFQCPVVMVLSDVSGRDDFQYAAERCLPQHIKQRYCGCWYLLCLRAVHKENFIAVFDSLQAAARVHCDGIP